MRISKRQFLAGSAAVGVGLYVAGRDMLGEGDSAGAGRDLLAVYDGRSDVGRAFAGQARSGGIATIDLAADPEVFWADARAGLGLRHGARLIGLTGWDERVYLAAHLAERRMRVRHEVRLDCCGLDPRADHRRDLLELALAEGSAVRRLAVAGRGGTLFAWRMA